MHAVPKTLKQVCKHSTSVCQGLLYILGKGFHDWPGAISKAVSHHVHAVNKCIKRAKQSPLHHMAVLFVAGGAVPRV